MIKSFNHKGLENFFYTGNKKGIQANHEKKLRLILAILNTMDELEPLSQSTFNLHPLSGDLKGHWSVKINGNWRITFKFTDKDVYIVDYMDYH